MARTMVVGDSSLLGQIRHTNTINQNGGPSLKPPTGAQKKNLLIVRSGADANTTLDTSIIVENASAINRTDVDGNKYINQYMLIKRLGK